MRNRLRSVLAAGMVVWALGCSTNPYTQRSQLVMTSSFYESNLGAAAYQTILEDPLTNISRDPADILPVQRVAARIIEAAKQSRYADIARSFEWDIAVIDDDGTRNAVALPGGKLLVYTGLFPIAKNEAGLAAVLGHEVVHALARHSGEQLTYDALQVMIRRDSLPFTRSHEFEADYIGLLLTAEAGYDPREAVNMWVRMKESGEELPPEYLSTHPSYDTRIAQLETHMPEARALYERTRLAPVACWKAVVSAELVPETSKLRTQNFLWDSSHAAD